MVKFGLDDRIPPFVAVFARSANYFSAFLIDEATNIA